MLTITRKKGSGRTKNSTSKRSPDHRGTHTRKIRELTPEQKEEKASNDRVYALGMKMLQGRN